jgi:multidrug efflux pump subunit AcrA (membrane-fusion protein)
MTQRRSIIAQRTPIFLGCEGESEQAYGQVLNDLLRGANRPVHLEVVNLNPGAGDPIARLRKAGQEIVRRRQRRSEFRLQVVLMDSDQVDADGKRRQQAELCAQALGVRVIWQEPCHEAMLLRHLDGFAQNRPATSAAAQAMLKAAWRDYRKPMTKIQLARRIDLGAIQRAAAVEPSLQAFLREITLLP